MLDQVPATPPAASATAQSADRAAVTPPEGALVIEILARPPAAAICPEREADPFQPEIIVCQEAAVSPRLARPIGPALDDFGNAIPQARLKLSESAEAQANLINKSVGGWNANGAEVRLKIDF